MPFFSNNTDVQINGGTFYDVSGNFTFEKKQQLLIQADRDQRTLERDSRVALEGSQLGLGTTDSHAGRALSGAARNGRERARHSPYGEHGRKHIPVIASNTSALDASFRSQNRAYPAGFSTPSSSQSQASYPSHALDHRSSYGYDSTARFDNSPRRAEPLLI